MKQLNLAVIFALSVGHLYGSVITYDAALNGPNDGTVSPGIGFAIVTIDTIAQSMEVNVTFSGLTTGNTASHIHCCVAPPGTAGVATITPTFTGFPSGVTSGSYDHVFDLTSSGTYNPPFIIGQGGTVPTAEAALLAGLAAGEAYVNIHTSNFPSGEISGFLVQTPEPSTLLLSASAFCALFFLRKRILG